MAGNIYLGGGGGVSDEADLWRAMFRGKSRVIYWSFALEPERTNTAAEWLTASLRHLDVDPEVETWTDLRDRSKGSLGSAELLFVGGGNTFRLLHHVRSHGFVDAVRDFVAAGGDYYGGSAGAILACEDVAIALQLDRNEGGLRDLSSLSLVREFSVFPHFTPALVAESQSWSATHKRTVLGIPERSGVVLRHGTAEVLGQESVWEVRGDQAKARVSGERWTFATE